MGHLPSWCWLAACLITVSLGVAGAQGRLARLNTVPSARDVLGSPPTQPVWLRKNLQAVRDSVDGDLVFIDDRGKMVCRAMVPTEVANTKVEAGDTEIRFTDHAAGRQFVVPRNVIPGQFRNVTITEIRDGRSIVSDLRRVDPRHPIISTRFGETIEVGPTHGGQLTDAYAIGSDSAGNCYVVAEEVVSSIPKLNVRATVERLNASGLLTGVADVPLNGMEVVPRDFATVTAAGEVRVLFPSANGVDIRSIQMTCTKPINLRATDQITPIGGGRSSTAVRRIKVETKLKKIDGAANFERESSARSQAFEPAPCSRTEIISTARSYLSVNWVFNEDNWAHEGVENICDKGNRKFWLRPFHFNRSMIGTVVGPMPYAWGGDDAPETFKDRLNCQHALAGSVCTCRDPSFNDCVFFPKAAGVDCSGFVSRSWGVRKLGTSSLLGISSTISMQDLKPGDAFDRPGHHIRLLVKMETGPPTAFRIIESTTRRDCEGVCEFPYRATQLNQYVPIRLRKVIHQ